MQSSKSPSRPGFTLVELLLLLGILLFLLAIFLPALFRLRQGADQVSSTNSLRMLGLAVHNAHDVNQKMPPLLGRYPAKDSPTSTLHFQLLPYLEQDNVFRRHQQDPLGAMAVKVPFFTDPRDPSAPSEGLYQGWLATTNYPGNWMVFRDTGASLAQIPDGTSNTLMFAQRYQMCNGQPAGWNYARLYHWAPMVAYYSKARFQANPKQEDCDPTLPQSMSPQGILVTMCDGSSRTVSASISPHVWWLVCDPNDGQPIPDDF